MPLFRCIIVETPDGFRAIAPELGLECDGATPEEARSRLEERGNARIASRGGLPPDGRVRKVCVRSARPL